MLQHGSSRQSNPKRKKSNDRHFVSAGELVAAVSTVDGAANGGHSEESMREVMERQGAFDRPSSMSVPRDLIEVRAYEIWLSEGCPEGRAPDHWRRAEQELGR